MARVRYIGDARVLAGFGPLASGTEYDLPDDMAASLIEQGKAVAVVVAVETPAVSRAPFVSRGVPRTGEGEE